jgi:hypothetical protein
MFESLKESGPEALRSEDTAMANLAITMSNAEPQRERVYPRTWVLYVPQHVPIKLIVTRNIESTPRVTSRAQIDATNGKSDSAARDT